MHQNGVHPRHHQTEDRYLHFIDCNVLTSLIEMIIFSLVPVLKSLIGRVTILLFLLMLLCNASFLRNKYKNASSLLRHSFTSAQHFRQLSVFNLTRCIVDIDIALKWLKIKKTNFQHISLMSNTNLSHKAYVGWL